MPKGVGDVADGGLGLTDATAESLAMAIHCVGGGNYCNTAIKNNQERGRILLDVAKSIPDGRMKSALEHWGHNLWHGTPEQRREATEQLARASTALGVGSAVVSPKVNPLNRPISQVGGLFRARNVPSTKAGAGVSLANPSGASKAVGTAAKAGQQVANGLGNINKQGANNLASIQASANRTITNNQLIELQSLLNNSKFEKIKINPCYCYWCSRSHFWKNDCGNKRRCSNKNCSSIIGICE